MAVLITGSRFDDGIFLPKTINGINADEQGNLQIESGKIDAIKVNGITQEIIDKSVNLAVLPLTGGNITGNLSISQKLTTTALEIVSNANSVLSILTEYSGSDFLPRIMISSKRININARIENLINPINPQDAATKSYVDSNGGKIDIIKLNGVALPINSTDKSVDITIPNMSAANVTYSNSTSGMAATNVQAALDEIVTGSLNMVTLNTAQTITGAKAFSAGIAANGGLTTTTLTASGLTSANGGLNTTNINASGAINATGNITGAKVYNAVWNDYAEWFEKDNIEDNFEAGDIIAWTGKGAKKATNKDECIIGAVSDSYGHILGGKNLEDMEDNKKEFVPVGLEGRIKCKVIGKVNMGDYIVPSDIPGIGQVDLNPSLNKIIGKALESSKNFNEKIIIVKIGI